jgi:chromate transporter
VAGALLCVIAIFLPSYLLIIGILPFWEQLRSFSKTQSAMQGMNAVVVGLLIAAFIHPVWSTAIHQWKDFLLASLSVYFLIFWKKPSWLVVLFCAFSGWLIF